MDAPLLLAFLLVLARMAGLFTFVPLPGGKNGPEVARVALAVGFTMALYPRWPALAGQPSMGWLVVALLAEAALGSIMGLAVACLAEGFLMMAQIVGLQAGYGYASTIDPDTQADATVLLVVAQMIAGLLFFAMGLDREMVRICARSLETHPAGSFLIKAPAAHAMIRLSSAIFSTGLRLALPVTALLALVDLALALLGRLNAQLQLVTLAFPAKMLLGLALLAALASLFPRIYAAGARDTLLVVEHLVGN